MLAAIITVVSIVGGAVYAGIRKFYCNAKTKGANDANSANEIKDLREQVDKLTSDYANLTQDILQYRNATEQKLDEIRNNQSVMKTDIEVTKVNISAIKDTLNRVFPIN